LVIDPICNYPGGGEKMKKSLFLASLLMMGATGVCLAPPKLNPTLTTEKQSCFKKCFACWRKSDTRQAALQGGMMLAVEGAQGTFDPSDLVRAGFMLLGGIWGDLSEKLQLAESDVKVSRQIARQAFDRINKKFVAEGATWFQGDDIFERTYKATNKVMGTLDVVVKTLFVGAGKDAQKYAGIVAAHAPAIIEKIMVKNNTSSKQYKTTILRASFAMVGDLSRNAVGSSVTPEMVQLTQILEGMLIRRLAQSAA
jgi:hypothetical protein